jgi:hypothetical protein
LKTITADTAASPRTQRKARLGERPRRANEDTASIEKRFLGQLQFLIVHSRGFG